LLRFFALNLAILVGCYWASLHFGFRPDIFINSVILLLIVNFIGMQFGEKNQRCFTSREKAAAIIGMLIIDVFVQTGWSLVQVTAEAKIRGVAMISYDQLVTKVGFVMVIHAIGIVYLFNKIDSRLRKQWPISM
jgi:hypothetical protein